MIFGEHHHDHHGDSSRGHEHDEQPNEHTWLDPILAAHGVTNILEALRRVDPRNEAGYTARARAYVTRLHELDAEIRQTLSGITNRTIVTYHDAFPYFARRYGLEVVGVVERTSDVNPTPKYLGRLGRLMKERKVRVIYVERGGMTRIARRIALDLRVELVELDTLETGPLTATGYEERMQFNAAVLRKTLN